MPLEERSTKKIQNLFFVMEYLDADLRTVLRSGVLTEISKEHIKLIVYNLLCAMKFCHSANVMHRDLKPANILVTKDCQVKLCDFGISRTLPVSLLEKGSGNSRRIRHAIFKNSMAREMDEAQRRKMVMKKLIKINEEE